MAQKKQPHKAKPTKKGRKYNRNRIGRSAGNLTKYRATGRRERNKARKMANLARKLQRRRDRRFAQAGLRASV